MPFLSPSSLSSLLGQGPSPYRFRPCCSLPRQAAGCLQAILHNVCVLSFVLSGFWTLQCLLINTGTHSKGIWADQPLTESSQISNGVKLTHILSMPPPFHKCLPCTSERGGLPHPQGQLESLHVFSHQMYFGILWGRNVTHRCVTPVTAVSTGADKAHQTFSVVAWEPQVATCYLGERQSLSLWASKSFHCEMWTKGVQG